MYRASLRGGAIAGTLLGSVAVAVAQEAGAGQLASPVAPDAATHGQAVPGADRDSVPAFLIPGQLNLTAQHRQQIRQSIERTSVEQQPVPRAFALAAGMTAPPELKLTSLPQELQQIPGIGKHHQFASLKGGAILIVGEGRLVAALIRSDER